MKHLLLVAAMALTACEVAPVSDESETIPADLSGNWGLVAGDCIVGASDAKGLMTVGITELVFYESRATLASVAARSETMISGRFNFTGEGQSWTSDMMLQLSGPNKLIRSESDPDGIGAPLTYTRCP